MVGQVNRIVFLLECIHLLTRELMVCRTKGLPSWDNFQRISKRGVLESKMQECNQSKLLLQQQKCFVFFVFFNNHQAKKKRYFNFVGFLWDIGSKSWFFIKNNWTQKPSFFFSSLFLHYSCTKGKKLEERSERKGQKKIMWLADNAIKIKRLTLN